MFCKPLLRVVLSVCLIAPLAIVQAQTPQPSNAPGTFSGRLSGAGMDGATITLTNTATGQAHSAVTDGNGNFTISDLTPGTYRATVKTKSGLQLRETSIQIMPNGTGTNQIHVTVDATPAAPAGKLQLTGKTPVLELSSAEVARSYDSTFIREIPLLYRQNQELISLMPGVTPPLVLPRIVDPQGVAILNVNGLPTWANLYTQEAAWNNEPNTGLPLRVPPNETVMSLEVRTSNYSTDYGPSGGAWSSTVTRPGTNAVHGSLFEFNTNNYFITGQSIPETNHTPRLTVNQFGGAAGGALRTDKLFWFLSYEGLIQRGGIENVATVPTLDMGNGNFSGVPGAAVFNPFVVIGGNRVPFLNNTVPGFLTNANSAAILSLIPLPNLPGFSNNLVGPVTQLVDNHRADGKVDYRFSDKNTGFLRYGYTTDDVNQGSLLGIVGDPLLNGLRAQNAVGSFVRIFNANLLTEVRLAYDRYRNQISPWGDFTGLNNGFLPNFPNGLPFIDITGFTPLGFPGNVPRKVTDNVFDGSNDWLFHKGIHSLKIGIGGRELQSNGFSEPFFGPQGSFIFGAGATVGAPLGFTVNQPALQANALAGFLLGAPNQAGVSSFTTTPGYRQRQWDAYATDTISWHQKFNFEFGVRYDVFRPVQAAQAGGQVIFDPVTNTTIPLGVGSTTNSGYRTDLDNVAPTVGIAYRPADRFVIRAGYGMHYFPIPFSLLPFNPAMVGAQSGIAGGFGVTTFTLPVIPAPGTVSAFNLPYQIFSRNQQTPYAQTYNFMVQGDLGHGILVDGGYVGNTAFHLPYTAVDAGLPGTGPAGVPGTGTALTYERGTGLTSNYNSLQINITKKFSKEGLAFSAAYTYSRALDYGQFLLDPFVRSNNYGPADWDRHHILAVTHVWNLPFGKNGSYMKSGWAGHLLSDWSFNGILRWATGTPYTVTTDPLTCGCIGVPGIPAAFIGPSSLNGSSNFDQAQFATPLAGTFGTLNRNGFRGPDLFTYNAALYRDFTFTDRWKLELRGEAYNLTNTSNFRSPVASADVAGFGTTPGTVNGQAGRQFQVAARLLF
jgi:hypothetical protein